MGIFSDLGTVMKDGLSYVFGKKKDRYGQSFKQSVPQHIKENLNLLANVKDLKITNVHASDLKTGADVLKGSLDSLTPANLNQSIELEKKVFHTGVKPIDGVSGALFSTIKPIGTAVHSVSDTALQTAVIIGQPMTEIAKADVAVAKVGAELGYQTIKHADSIINGVDEVIDWISEHPYIVIGGVVYYILKK